MLLCPFQHQSERPSRHVSLKNLQWLDAYEHFVLSIEGMKVWWRVILPEHLDQDTVKHADSWQE